MLKLKDIFDYRKVVKRVDEKNLYFSEKALKTVCFSGPRAEKLERLGIKDDTPAYDEFKRYLVRAILIALKKGYRTFFTGCCSGLDIIAGEIIADLKEKGFAVELIAVVPFRGQATKFSPAWKERYYELLSKANTKIELQERYTANCYQRRNEYMANRSSMLICYYNGDRGGTKNTYNLCKRLNLEIINIADFS